MNRAVRETAAIGLLVAGFAVASPATCAAQAREEPVRTITSVEPRSVTIGTPFRYTVRFDVESGIELALPVPTENIGRFFILDFGDVAATADAASGRVVYERWYDLVAYDTGDDLIPGAPVGWRGPDGELHTTYLPDTPITIESVLPRSTDSSEPLPLDQIDLRDIKAPVEPPRKPWPIAWIAAGVLAGLSLATLVYRRWSRERVPLSRRPLPHEIALDELRALRADALFEQARLEEFYIKLSRIVRVYLEARFALRAPEMTTEEFLQAAHRATQLDEKDRGSLQVFLSEADLVKFARMRPSRDDADRAWTAADGFVRATAPQRADGDKHAAA